MLHWRGVEEVPVDWGRCVVTIGSFDGVHRGHQKIIGRAVDRARQLGVPAVVLTFDPHPSEVVRPGSHPPILASQRFRAELMSRLGVDAVLVVPFTVELSHMLPDEFVRVVLVDTLHAQVVVVGENFRYGHRAAGNLGTLSEAGMRQGFTVEGMHLVGDGERTFSSTEVRRAVLEGDVDLAAELLGRPHRVEGVVVRGDQRGRELGYPTANVETAPFTAIPADGVYAGFLVLGHGTAAEALPAAISVGTNPTFAGTERRVEAYAIDRDDLDLYGSHVAVEFVARLREMLKFDSVEDLLVQIADDVKQSRKILETFGG